MPVNIKQLRERSVESIGKKMARRVRENVNEAKRAGWTLIQVSRESEEPTEDRTISGISPKTRLREVYIVLSCKR